MLLRQASQRIDGGDTGRLDAELLLAKVLACSRTHLYAHPERLLNPAEQLAFAALLERRIAGEPVAYLLGTRPFWTFDLLVNRDVLIPRPETELLVELAMALPDLPPRALVADLGTGSGAIALALASENADWHLVASDRSAKALQVARHNAGKLGLDNISFVQADWCQPWAGQAFDMLVSNPPYVETGDPHLQQGDLRFEPMSALVAPVAGLADLTTLCRQAGACLKPGAWLLLEHGFGQGADVRGLLQENGYGEVATHRDLGGNERVTLGQWSLPGQ
ncbi:MAG: peptide chain release factor N(5)-glutamine methyltransferase [Pseudomonadales bacterium]|nr:peptide chain release factor N(5)-glutamine methyltransferase [Pseudomonadales bacterium]